MEYGFCSLSWFLYEKSQCHKEIILPLILLAKYNNAEFYVDKRKWKNKLQFISLVIRLKVYQERNMMRLA